MKKNYFSIIVAFDSQYGIGKKGQLAWSLPSDLRRFKEITTAVNDPSRKNALIMGRKTWDSLPQKYRPLPGRVNMVLSKEGKIELDSCFRGNDEQLRVSVNTTIKENVLCAQSLDEALNQLSSPNIENIFVIGGAQIYAFAIVHPLCQKLYVTHVQGNYGCDAFFPPISKDFFPISASEFYQEAGIHYQFSDYLRY